MITEFKTLLELTRYFSNEKKCRKYYAQIRWNGQPVCPHCGSINTYTFKDGILYKCAEKECKRKFTVRVGTIFENSKVPLQKWFMAIWFLTSHKKGISSYQLAKDIGVTQKTAWYMAHRVREMLREKQPIFLQDVVEIDEAYFNGKISNRHKNERQRLKQAYYYNKTGLFTLLERKTGRISHKVLTEVTQENIMPVIEANVDSSALLITDTAGVYRGLKRTYNHEAVNHNKEEFVRGNIYTNTVEGFFSLLKRQVYGIHHHVTPKHLSRYCSEMAFRYERREQGESERFYNSFLQAESYLPYKKLIANELTSNDRA